MEATYRITIQKLSTGEHRTSNIKLTDEKYYKWQSRLNKAEGGYMLTRIEIVL